ncbi:hypothetical protein AAKU64_004647 [Undibacterium sp. GrIS 1.8]|uniref:hypothetical protein n=1 Tax=Undibacterium sp. GrIS 1.8 TaxID=3143934 RepID=UPI003398A25E
MIEFFVVVSKNGFKLTPGEDPVGISDMDLFKPEYLPNHYLWEVNGVTYTRQCDPIETRSIKVTPDMKYLVVEQSPSKYGSDNLLVLNPDGTENRRLINPYRFSSEYQDGDEFEFRDIQNMRDKLLARISVSRDLPNKSYKAEPVYGTFYDCDTWDSTPLEFIDSRNL